MTTKQEWIKNFESVHTFSNEELEVLRQAKEIQSDPRFTGNWESALKIAIDLKFDDVEADPNAMMVRR